TTESRGPMTGKAGRNILRPVAIEGEPFAPGDIAAKGRTGRGGRAQAGVVVAQGLALPGRQRTRDDRHGFVLAGAGDIVIELFDDIGRRQAREPWDGLAALALDTVTRGAGPGVAPSLADEAGDPGVNRRLGRPGPVRLGRQSGLERRGNLPAAFPRPAVRKA